jgi:ABC-type glycerol-3-phosphate transport system permease component
MLRCDRARFPPGPARSVHHGAGTLLLVIQFLFSDQYQDIGILATGLMIGTLPVLVLSVFLSKWVIIGMTIGAIG